MQRLPIFAILLDGTTPAALPAFLRLFQNALERRRRAAGPPARQYRDRKVITEAIAFEECPFVGLACSSSDGQPESVVFDAVASAVA